MRIVHSGHRIDQARVRGTMPPSYNIIEIDEQSVSITLHQPARARSQGAPRLLLPHPVTTSEFYPAFERFVLYDRLPFLRPGINEPPDSASEAGGGPKR